MSTISDYFWLDDDQRLQMYDTISRAGSHVGFVKLGSARRAELKKLFGQSANDIGCLPISSITNEPSIEDPNTGVVYDSIISLRDNHLLQLKLALTDYYIFPDPTGESWGNCKVAAIDTVPYYTNIRGEIMKSALNVTLEHQTGQIGPHLSDVMFCVEGIEPQLATDVDSSLIDVVQSRFGYWHVARKSYPLTSEQRWAIGSTDSLIKEPACCIGRVWVRAAIAKQYANSAWLTCTV